MTPIEHKTPKRQQGAAAVEFALVALIFFTLLLGIMEFGRFLYLYNTVQEVTRRAAREATVSCTDNATLNEIRRKAVFGTGAVPAMLPAGAEITDTVISIDYLKADRTAISGQPPTDCPNTNIEICLADPNDNKCISFVRVSISGVQYMPMIGLFSFLTIPIPTSTVVMPAESLGLL